MSFIFKYSQFFIFALFLVLGLKMGVEQEFFFWVRKFSTNKFAGVLFTILNILFVVVNCAQFYFLSLKMNYGSLRVYMFLAFFLGVFLINILARLLKKLKSLKKAKKRQAEN